MVRAATAAVGWLSIATGVYAVYFPESMYSFWPPRRDAHLRLMQAWGVVGTGLGSILCGVSAEKATLAVCGVSIFWDICWVPEPGSGQRQFSSGHIAAAVNAAAMVLLFYDLCRR